MIKVNWDLFKCRCSGISKILSNKQGYAPITDVQKARIKELEDKKASDKGVTEKQQIELTELILKQDRSKEVILSDMCIAYLMEVYAWETEGMISVSKESLEIAATEKGKRGEREGGVLLSIVDGEIYLEHKDRISNNYLSGEIDFYLGLSVYEASRIVDIKNAFDYPGFLKKINNGLENGQRHQVAGYCDITGASEGFIANTLVDNPDEIIEEMRWKLTRKLGATTPESPEVLAEWPRWERSMKFSHISPQKRVHKIQIELFSENERQQIYDRVKYCREWLWKFDEAYQKMNQ